MRHYLLAAICLLCMDSGAAARTSNYDFDGDGTHDIAAWRPEDGQWLVLLSRLDWKRGPWRKWGSFVDRPRANIDVDGDGRSDMAVRHPQDAVWYVLTSGSDWTSDIRSYAQGPFSCTSVRPPCPPGHSSVSAVLTNGNYGTVGRWLGYANEMLDVDFGGDNGRNDATTYINLGDGQGTWYLNDAQFWWPSFFCCFYRTITWPWHVDMAIEGGDFDKDGVTDLVGWNRQPLTRPRSGFWLVLFSGSGWSSSLAMGRELSGDVPLPKVDFDGDQQTDLAAWSRSDGTWHARLSGDGWNTPHVFPAAGTRFGEEGDCIFTADFDGDEMADIGFWRPTDGTWHVRYSSSKYTSGLDWQVSWGVQPQDVPIVRGDFDRPPDGKADMAVWRADRQTGWQVLLSSKGWEKGFGMVFDDPNLPSIPMGDTCIDTRPF